MSKDYIIFCRNGKEVKFEVTSRKSEVMGYGVTKFAGNMEGNPKILIQGKVLRE